MSFIEVAFGREHLRRPEVGAQDRGDHLLHRGLAVGPADRDERDIEARAPLSAARRFSEVLVSATK